MSDVTFISFGSQCTATASIGSEQQMQKHYQSTKIYHKCMKMQRLHEKCKNFEEKIQTTTLKLVQLKQSLIGAVYEVIKTIQKMRDDFVGRIQKEIIEYWRLNNIKMNKQDTIKLVKKRQFEHFTCSDMQELIEVINSVTKSKEFSKKEKPKVEKTVSQLGQSFSRQLQSTLRVQLGDLSQRLKPFRPQKSFEQKPSLSHTLSSIQMNQTSSFISKNTQIVNHLGLSFESRSSKQVQSSVEQDTRKKNDQMKKIKDKSSMDTFGEQKSKSVISIAKKEQKSVRHKKQYVRQQKKYESSMFSMKNQYSGELSSFLGSEQFSQSNHSQTFIENEPNQNKSFYNYEKIVEDSDGLSDMEQQNESQLNQTLIMFRDEIQNKDFSSYKDDKPNFTTINHCQKYKKLESTFNTKVSIIKILYYSVLESHIPKIKFIAGDQTGYGVFFTNFYPGLKVGTQLQMRQCRFNSYKGSDEVINQDRFRIMREYQPKITVNMKGHRLNKAITSDLYYPLEDKRCTLVRQVADILNSGKTVEYFVRRMTVKVVTILSEQSNGLFCIVGDSSGMMMAYLRKTYLKSINTQDVVRLLNVKGILGECKHYYLREQMLYIDTSSKQSKVLEHTFGFLEVCDNMMTMN